MTSYRVGTVHSVTSGRPPVCVCARRGLHHQRASTREWLPPPPPSNLSSSHIDYSSAKTKKNRKPLTEMTCNRSRLPTTLSPSPPRLPPSLPVPAIVAHLSHAIFPSRCELVENPDAILAGHFFHRVVFLLLELAIVRLIDERTTAPTKVITTMFEARQQQQRLSPQCTKGASTKQNMCACSEHNVTHVTLALSLP